MATVSLSAISAVMNLIFGDAMADQIRRDVLLPNLLPVRTGRNSTMTWTAKFSNRSAGGAFAEGADMADADFDSHARVQASLAWAEYRTGAKVSGLSEALSRVNGSPSLDPSLFSDEIRDAIDYLAVLVSSDSYAGNVAASPPELAGLATAVDSSGTYAGIAPGTYSEWASAENTLAATALTVDKIRENLIRPIIDNCGMYPQFLIAPGNVFDDVGALLGDKRQYIDEVQTIDGQTVNLKSRGGFRAIEIDGVPLIEDRHCTANTIYGFARDAVEYQQVPAVGPEQAGVVMQAVKALTGVTLEEDEVAMMLRASTQRLQPSIAMLGKTGDNVKAMVKVYAQLGVRYRNRCGKLTLT